MNIIDNNQNTINGLLSSVKFLLWVIFLLLCVIVIEPFIIHYINKPKATQNDQNNLKPKDEIAYWKAADIYEASDEKLKKSLILGQSLIEHTSRYFGPNGSVLKMSNGLNCQNCHLKAGTATFGNNYGSVAATYPKFRARSGTVENLFKRVNDCFQRSLNGQALDSTSIEMQAMIAYINYIGKDVKKGEKAVGSGLKDLVYLDRAADPVKGKELYTAKCESCHQQNGEGLFNGDKTEYTYPALWGKHSYNDGAGLFRISNFAKYIKYNMPQGATFDNPQLSDEEAWDISAYVNAQPRPHINVATDWPEISKKPVDHPFGPYVDDFTEKQHKYGPFKPIVEAKKNSIVTDKVDKLSTK